MSGKVIAIGMLWHTFDSGNHGVNALTVSNAAIARGVAVAMGLTPRFVFFAPGASTTALSTDDGDTIVHINRATMITSRKYWSMLGQIDCMLDISAGDSFADIYGPKRFFWVWLTKRLTLLRGIPLMLSPMTIGPFTRQPYRRLAAGILQRATLTFARDPLSFAAIEDMAPGARRMLSADVAFRLPFARRLPANDGRTHIGLNVSGLLWHQSEIGANAYNLSYDYRAMTELLLDELTVREDIQVHLITHVVDAALRNDSDGTVADILAKRYPSVIRVADFDGPSAAKSYISGLDVMIGARMHACIAAFSSGVPVIPIAYSRKFMGLFGELLDYPHTLPPSGYTAEQAVGTILDLIERRSELAEAERRGNAKVQPLLDDYEGALRELFAKSRNKGPSS